VEHLIGQTIEMIAERISENEHEDRIKKILATIKSVKTKKGWIEKRQILKRFRNIPKRDINNILDRLLEEEVILTNKIDNVLSRVPGVHKRTGRIGQMFVAKKPGQNGTEWYETGTKEK
jgi:hypothetical protein